MLYTFMSHHKKKKKTAYKPNLLHFPRTPPKGPLVAEIATHVQIYLIGGI